jgi:hypothetical protein
MLVGTIALVPALVAVHVPLLLLVIPMTLVMLVMMGLGESAGRQACDDRSGEDFLVHVAVSMDE